jgi:predicted thioesterase
MRQVPIGITRRESFGAGPGDTAAAVGNTGVEAIATVAMILWVEATCGRLLQPYAEEREATVGVRVALDHMGPAFAGRPVDVLA